MSELSQLIGARVDSVAFGEAHFRLDLSGAGRRFWISTAANVGASEGDLTDFREAKRGENIVGLLTAGLVDITVSGDCRSGTIEFDNGVKLRVWWPDKACDNLFIARDSDEEWWFAIG